MRSKRISSQLSILLQTGMELDGYGTIRRIFYRFSKVFKNSREPKHLKNRQSQKCICLPHNIFCLIFLVKTLFRTIKFIFTKIDIFIHLEKFINFFSIGIFKYYHKQMIQILIRIDDGQYNAQMSTGRVLDNINIIVDLLISHFSIVYDVKQKHKKLFQLYTVY